MDKKVKLISEILNIKEATVALVLYCYLSECLQKLVINGYTDTIFGKLYMRQDGTLEFDNNKLEFNNELFTKKDILSIFKVVEHGPGAKLFPM
jgi:hypothetical protein